MPLSSQEGDPLVSQLHPTYGKVQEENDSAEVPPSSHGRHFLPFRAAAILILVLLSAILVYHALILTQVVPYEKVWGGQLTSLKQMYRFETISVAINLLILVVAAIRFVNDSNNNKCLSILCCIFSGLYALNTLGNLFAQTNFERIVFTPVTLLLSICFARLASGRQQQENAG